MTREISQAERAKRTLCVVDVENCASTSDLTLEHALHVQDAINRAVPGIVMHVVGCSHRNAAAARFAFDRSRIVVRSGVDGADLALIEVLETERIEQRFSRVVIASGDHIFVPAIRRLREAGVEVEALSVAGQLSHELAWTCSNVRYLSVSNLEVGNV